MDVARIKEIDTSFFAPACRARRDHRAWTAALVVSISAHALMVWLWDFPKPEPAPYPETISIKLQRQAVRMPPLPKSVKQKV